MMYYHLIMVVRYRRKVIDNPISERAKEIWEHIAQRYGGGLEEWNHDIDHVHGSRDDRRNACAGKPHRCIKIIIELIVI